MNLELENCPEITLPVVAQARLPQTRLAARLDALHRWWTRPGVAWGAIILLGLVAMWRIWDTVDLTHGDTSNYYGGATSWRDTRTLVRPSQMVFSPLYQVFFGELLRIFSDIYAATIIHRLLIMLASAAAVLGIMRNLLPKSLAWLIAAWWIVLPINWAGVYEVHFFGFFWAALGCWLAGAGRGVWWRGCGLAALLCSGLLVRNELLLATALFALCGAGFDLYRLSKGHADLRQTAGNLLRFATPSLLLIFLAALLFSGNPKVERWKNIRAAFQSRERANIAQVYGFGYWQRYPKWTDDPWSGDSNAALMVRDFGSANARWSDALRKNPKAFLAYVAWNFHLLPAGLELGLFNSYSGRYSPDFSDSVIPSSARKDKHASDNLFSMIPSTVLLDNHASGNSFPMIGLGALAVLWLAGLIWASRGRRPGRLLESKRIWTWLALISCIASSLVGIATQHPRPAYIEPLLVFCMAITGLSLAALARRWAISPRKMAWAATCACIFALIVESIVPGRRPLHRPLLVHYRRLQPYAEIICHEGRVFCSNVSPLFLGDLSHYLAPTQRSRPDALHLARLEAGLAASEPLEAGLDRAGVTDLYLTGPAFDQEAVRGWRETAESAGWRLIAKSDVSDARWQLFSRDLEKGQTLKQPFTLRSIDDDLRTDQIAFVSPALP